MKNAKKFESNFFSTDDRIIYCGLSECVYDQTYLHFCSFESVFLQHRCTSARQTTGSKFKDAFYLEVRVFKIIFTIRRLVTRVDSSH